MQVWYAARESNAANPTKASARCQVEGASLTQASFPFNHRRRNHVCFKLMSDSARSKSKLLRDLENHLFPHTVPIKGRGSTPKRCPVRLQVRERGRALTPINEVGI